jgi:hypothetical protein
VKSYAIFIDGLAYCGEDCENTTPADYGGDGWNVKNNNEISQLIITGNEPKIIDGNICLKSEIDRILRRIKLGHINPRKIEIEMIDE